MSFVAFILVLSCKSIYGDQTVGYPDCVLSKSWSQRAFFSHKKNLLRVQKLFGVRLGISINKLTDSGSMLDNECGLLFR